MLMNHLIAAMRSLAAARLTGATLIDGHPGRGAWLGQHTNPRKNDARKARRLIGARQQRIRRKELNRILKLAAVHGYDAS